MSAKANFQWQSRWSDEMGGVGKRQDYVPDRRRHGYMLLVHSRARVASLSRSFVPVHGQPGCRPLIVGTENECLRTCKLAGAIEQARKPLKWLDLFANPHRHHRHTERRPGESSATESSMSSRSDDPFNVRLGSHTNHAGTHCSQPAHSPSSRFQPSSGSLGSL